MHQQGQRDALYRRAGHAGVTLGSASSIYAPISVSLDERDALRRYLLDTEGVWSLRDWDLPTFVAKLSDAHRLLADLKRDEDLRGRLELTLLPTDLRRVFTDIRDGLFVIDHSDPEQDLIVAGVCERVLGIGGKA